MIALAVADVDECSYCQAAHTAGREAAGLSEPVVALNLDLFTNDFDNLVQTELDLPAAPSP